MGRSSADAVAARARIDGGPAAGSAPARSGRPAQAREAGAPQRAAGIPCPRDTIPHSNAAWAVVVLQHGHGVRDAGRRDRIRDRTRDALSRRPGDEFPRQVQGVGWISEGMSPMHAAPWSTPAAYWRRDVALRAVWA